MSRKRKVSKEKVCLTRAEACGYIPGKGGFKPKENKDRRQHYKKLRRAGFPSKVACALRDWKLPKIELFITSNNPK